MFSLNNQPVKKSLAEKEREQLSLVTMDHLVPMFAHSDKNKLGSYIYFRNRIARDQPKSKPPRATRTLHLIKEY